MWARCVGFLFVFMVFSPLLIGCVIAADAHRLRRRKRRAGKSLYRACEATFARPSAALARNGLCRIWGLLRPPRRRKRSHRQGCKDAAAKGKAPGRTAPLPALTSWRNGIGTGAAIGRRRR